MKILESNYEKIKDELLELHREGAAYIAYLSNPAELVISVKDLPSFSKAYDAAEYCFEMSTDVDIMHSQPIWPLYRAMEKGMQEKSLLEGQQEVIDIAALLRAYYRLQPDTIKNQNNMDMNQKNLDYLTDQIKYTGFGEGFADVLKEKMATGDKEFKIDHSAKIGNDTIEASLNFSKSKQSDMYFYNSYKVSLQKEGSAEKLDQTFYINRGNNITLKEAYNLMEGRAVYKNLTNKEEEKYGAWVQLDFKHSDQNGDFRLKKFGENYGYDMEAALSKYPIKELQRDDFKDNLMDSLKKGNAHPVTFQVDGKEERHYIEANPHFKTVNVYNSDMQRLGSREARAEKQGQAETQSQGEGQDNKKANKTEVKDAEVVSDGATAEKVKKSRGQKV